MTTTKKIGRIGWLSLACGVAAVATGCATGESADGRVAQEIRIRQVVLPESFEDARQAAFDLDGDGAPDNAAGAALVSLFANFDDARELIERAANAALADRAEWTLAIERDPASGLVEAVALGAGDEGAAMVPASLLSDALGDAPIAWVEVIDLTAELQAAPDGTVSGRIGFGIPAEALEQIAEPLARYFTEQLAAGRLQVTAAMDADGDGVITGAELLEFELVRTLLRPDLDLDGDGQPDAWSAALRIRAGQPSEIVVD